MESLARYGVRDAEDAPFWVMDDPNDPWNPLASASPAHPAVAMPGAVPPVIPVGSTTSTFAVRPAGNNAPPAGPPRSFPAVVPASGPNSNLPSFPVMIDPIGAFSYTGDTVFWSANAYVPATTFAVPRRTARTAGVNIVQATRTCTMFDDIEFSRAATPGAPAGAAETGTLSGAAVLRQGRYNWGAVIQRPNNANRYTADLKILVYDRRAPGVAPADAELQFSAPGVTDVVVGSTQLVLPATLDVLKLRTNGWIMDGTINPALGIRNANFYRIQSLTETGGGATVVELQTPIRPPTGAAGVPGYTAQIYVLSNLIEVFDRPQLQPTTFSVQVP